MKSRCDNCGWEGEPLFGLEEIVDLVERIDPGGVVPSGECPECDALCYPEQKERDPAQCPNRAAAELLPEVVAALDALFEHCCMVHKRWGEGCNLKEANAAESAAREVLAKAKEALK